jgi:(p)ppGpp synthase/HD superfamily hydrolase
MTISRLEYKAYSFAKSVHFQLLPNMPLFEHVSKMALTVDRFTKVPEVLAASWLYYVLGDKKVTKTCIKKEFGNKVLKLILEARGKPKSKEARMIKAAVTLAEIADEVI